MSAAPGQDGSAATPGVNADAGGSTKTAQANPEASQVLPPRPPEDDSTQDRKEADAQAPAPAGDMSTTGKSMSQMLPPMNLNMNISLAATKQALNAKLKKDFEGKKEIREIKVRVVGFKSLDAGQDGKPDIDAMADALNEDDDAGEVYDENEGKEAIPFEEELTRLKAELQRAVDAGVDVLECFQHFDTDGSGDLDEGEFKLGLERLGITLSDERSYARMMEKFSAAGGDTILYRDFMKTLDLPGLVTDSEDGAEEDKPPSAEEKAQAEAHEAEEQEQKLVISALKDKQKGFLWFKKKLDDSEQDLLILNELKPVTRIERRELGEVQIGNVYTMTVLHPCKAEIVKKKLMGATGAHVLGQRLVWQGKVIKDDEPIPEECYVNEPDEDGFVTYLMMSMADFDMPEEDPFASGKKKGDLDLDLFADQEESEEESEAGKSAEDHEALLRKRQQKANKDFDKMLRKLQEFNLAAELEHIKCSAYAEALSARGFNELGAFAHITEEELEGEGLWICKRARRRILALADVYRRQSELDELKRESALTKIERERQERENASRFSVDGENFFSTKRDLEKIWREAQHYENEVLAEEEKIRVQQELEAAKQAEEERLKAKVQSRNMIRKASVFGGVPSAELIKRRSRSKKGKTFTASLASLDPNARQKAVLGRYIKMKAKNLVGKNTKKGVHMQDSDEQQPGSAATRSHKLENARLIRELRARSARDQFDLPVGFYQRPTCFCCQKHASLVKFSFAKYLKNISSEVCGWIRTEINEADVLKNNFVPKDHMHMIASEILFEYGIEPSPRILDDIFQGCEDPKERLYYDYTKFLRTIDTLVFREEEKRLVHLTSHTVLS